MQERLEGQGRGGERKRYPRRHALLGRECRIELIGQEEGKESSSYYQGEKERNRRDFFGQERQRKGNIFLPENKPKVGLYFALEKGRRGGSNPCAGIERELRSW